MADNEQRNFRERLATALNSGGDALTDESLAERVGAESSWGARIRKAAQTVTDEETAQRVASELMGAMFGAVRPPEPGKERAAAAVRKYLKHGDLDTSNALRKLRGNREDTE